MNRLRLVLMAIALGAIFVGSGLAQPVSAQGASRALSANLSGTAEVPSLETTASGSFFGTFSGGELSFRLQSDAVGITQAHIHMGAVDANGAPVVFLFGAVDPGVDGIDVSGTITEADLIGAVEGDFQAFATALLAGNGYVNVHTEANPGGEVRGQISVGEVSTADTVNSTAMPLVAGGNLIGWFGLDTTSTAILAGNADLTIVWVFVAGAWSSDSALLPEGLRSAIAITRGTGLFIVATAATDLMVPTSVSSTVPFAVQNDETGLAANAGTLLGFNATLTRSLDGVSASASVSGLTPGGTYTLWIIIWNNPAACAAVCGLEDFGNADVVGSGVNGDGEIADANGNATYAATLVAGDVGHHSVIFGPGLTDPIGAEIRLFVRNHGPASADATELLEQLSLVEGGCTEESSETGTGTGTFTCFDPYSALFTGPGSALTAAIAAFDDSGVSGSATLSAEGDGISVQVTVAGLSEGVHANHLHHGSCAELGPIHVPLSDLSAGADGDASGATVWPDNGLDHFASGHYYAVHELVTFAVIGCGDVS